MNHPTEENLLGYVLGALDAQEQRDVQEAIDTNPELEERLLELKNALRPLDYLDTSGPRPGLARRTCEMVASVAGTSNQLVSSKSYAANSFITDDLDSHPQLNSPAPRRQLLRTSTWSLPDFAVAVAGMAIVASILFPAISYTRYNSRLSFCQNNLRQLGGALVSFSDTHEGRFVDIPRSGPLAVSGSFAPLLKDAGFVTDDAVFACAGATAESEHDAPLHIPTVAAIKSATGEQLVHLQRTMGGHYGYTLGYCTTEGYCPPRNLGRTNVVLLADAPSLNLTGRVSPNHGGRGQNVLFEDGHVRYVAGASIGEDALFVNDCNLVAPGCRPSDNVIAPSHLSPVASY